MKREIKFRFWLGHTKKMTYAHKLQDVGKIIPEFTDDIIPLQFTGLLDKNGKEIFEGDVVIRESEDLSETNNWKKDDPRWEQKYEFPRNEVMRDVVTLAVFGFWLKNESFGWEGEDLESPTMCEVIGNIYENPHLIPK